MVLGNGKIIALKQLPADDINMTALKTSHMTHERQNKLRQIGSKYHNLFTAPDEKLTYITRITGAICTTTNDPVYSKTYPYLMSLKKEIKDQVRTLLKGGIIRPSKYP